MVNLRLIKWHIFQCNENHLFNAFCLFYIQSMKFILFIAEAVSLIPVWSVITLAGSRFLWEEMSEENSCRSCFIWIDVYHPIQTGADSPVSPNNLISWLISCTGWRYYVQWSSLDLSPAKMCLVVLYATHFPSSIVCQSTPLLTSATQGVKHEGKVHIALRMRMASKWKTSPFKLAKLEDRVFVQNILQKRDSCGALRFLPIYCQIGWFRARD